MPGFGGLVSGLSSHTPRPVHFRLARRGLTLSASSERYHDWAWPAGMAESLLPRLRLFREI